MIRTYFFVFILLISASCTRNYFPYSQDYLNQIPLELHNNKIPFYFPGEQLPKEAYVKIKVFEIKGFYGESFSSMLKKMEHKARVTGVDAVMIISNEKNVYTKYERTLIDEILNPEDDQRMEDITNYEVSTVVGIGIKFLKNMEGLENQVKKSEVVVDVNNDTQKKATVFYDFNGNIIKTEGESFYTDIIQNYSLSYLAYDFSKNWKHRKEGENIITRFLFDDSGTTIKKCTLYFFDNRVTSVFVRDNSDRFREMEKVLFFYNPKGELEHKEIILKDGKMMKQYFEWDDDKIIRSVFYTYETGKESKMFEIINEFYSTDDIPREMIVENH